jgi:hypothetical protein
LDAYSIEKKLDVNLSIMYLEFSCDYGVKKKLKFNKKHIFIALHLRIDKTKFYLKLLKAQLMELSKRKIKEHKVVAQT